MYIGMYTDRKTDLVQVAFVQRDCEVKENLENLTTQVNVLFTERDASLLLVPQGQVQHLYQVGQAMQVCPQLGPGK